MLFNYGVDVNANDENFNSPLHYTAIRGLYELGAYIVRICNNPYTINEDGRLPWECVVDQDQVHHYKICVVCKNPGVQSCKNCKVVFYCGIECQKKDYTTHQKKVCQSLLHREQEARLRKISIACASPDTNL